MARSFDVPFFYRSDLVSGIKKKRREEDPKKKDLSVSILEFGNITFKLARHFGFCFGVENAIEIAYKALAENPNKRIFLLSEMIHNPNVNNDLLNRGVRFLMSTYGEELIPFSEITANDIVIVPAFGTTLEIFEKLKNLGIDPQTYNATCPFVERVWKRAAQLGENNFTIIIHGKAKHEETRATFSHASFSGPSVVVRDIEQAKILAKHIEFRADSKGFFSEFAEETSANFDYVKDLDRVGVVNQTTMLAEETQGITDLLREAMLRRVGSGKILDHFADTKDTLCYATSENQQAVKSMVREDADLAIVVGGYNSSNTSHLVEICEEHLSTYYIKDASELLGLDSIQHLDLKTNEIKVSKNWLRDFSKENPLKILITAGASCPDALVEEIINKILSLTSQSNK